MPNVLDIRRRIRSVTNTRQITKAMKMVSAAKLRRAQDRALAARPYSQMLTNVLKSLVSRAEIYDPDTGEPRHPLLAERPEKTIQLVVITGDKGLAGAFNANILKTAQKFLDSKQDVNVDIVCVGRKGRDFLKRRYPSTARPVALEEMSEGAGADRSPAERAGRVQIVGEHVGVLGKLEFGQARALAEDVVRQFTRGEIDGVYLLYNEFKSVIAQRLIVEHLLPIREIGVVDVRLGE
jgi:F-type H+-transporting ATPase subunit gamma